MRLGLLALGTSLLGIVATATTVYRTPDPGGASLAYRLAQDSSGLGEQKRLRASAWQGGSFTTSSGESVRVLVSVGYPDGATIGQRWAEHFASLLHGSELGSMTAYVVTPDEVDEFCGPRALGCYTGGEFVFTNEDARGVTAEAVATHEYGHHVAASRLNTPWPAIDTGPKRWASAANVCLRAREGTAFPGNEDSNYDLNPGEAFAEVYRVLNELRAGATTFSWSLVSSSFHPSQLALDSAEQDVIAPWSAADTREVRARFKGSKVWRTVVSTPLDGNLVVSLKFPRGARHDLTVFGADGRTILGRGLWAGAAEKRLAATLCGQRSIVVRVTRKGPPGPFGIRVTHD